MRVSELPTMGKESGRTILNRFVRALDKEVHKRLILFLELCQCSRLRRQILITIMETLLGNILEFHATGIG